MKRKYIYPVLVLIVTISFYYLERYLDQNQDITVELENDDSKTAVSFYLPTSTTGSIVRHNFYTLSYSEKHEQAEWVAYELKKEHLSKKEHKRPYFEEDKKVRTSSADWRNYKKSGYDRGHLCPAGDRRFDYEAYEETFLTSNISPQSHQFNSGIWNSLEQKVRYWARIYDGVHVITGGVLTDDLATIGYEQVSVPKYFYKIVWDKTNEHIKTIAFLIPHKEINTSLDTYRVSIDKIEQLTGIDFFEKLDDKTENRIESVTDTKDWKL